MKKVNEGEEEEMANHKTRGARHRAHEASEGGEIVKNMIKKQKHKKREYIRSDLSQVLNKSKWAADLKKGKTTFDLIKCCVIATK